MSTKNLHLFDTFEKDGKKFARIPKHTINAGTSPKYSDLVVKDKSDFKAIVEKLELYGLCVVKHYLEPETCEHIKKELEPHYFRHQEWNGSPFPKETTVVTRAALASPTCMDKIALDDTFYKVSYHFMSESNVFWIGDGKLRRSETDVQLYSSIIYRVGAGAGDQMYHREDMALHNAHPRREKYHYGDDVQVGLAVALTPMNKTNGATRAIIGSHLWGPLDGPYEFDPQRELYLELEEGDGTFMLGSTYHAASSNHSDADRIGAFFFMSKTYLRQEENYHADMEPAFFENMSFKALKILGLHTSLPFCGHIGYRSPAFVLNPKLKEASQAGKGNYTEVIYPVFE
ncbi:hypothetical protein HG536_0D00130 [Torulaspora globosa]|uniref:Phytanoyl-CoA dioxygenase n=1 Tax=Torulaspora globosa TaxID=48254 RepID=A0A7G3ZG55_9SACH|nr:uncharacterized protein HG536_0A00130 [Torulaspora globosa]XP_037139166.1 uncharacterized protein HG536_0D00130 [Torulaspora globosa]QLL30196.1 hypothetical protein HG536_0A00130 [Torulaspora globosa]QLL32491.1 hypothetical protein HG536_0D00130 [Torulaspora globosa]